LNPNPAAVVVARLPVDSDARPVAPAPVLGSSFMSVSPPVVLTSPTAAATEEAAPAVTADCGSGGDGWDDVTAGVILPDTVCCLPPSCCLLDRHMDTHMDRHRDRHRDTWTDRETVAECGSGGDGWDDVTAGVILPDTVCCLPPSCCLLDRHTDRQAGTDR